MRLVDFVAAASNGSLVRDAQLQGWPSVCRLASACSWRNLYRAPGLSAAPSDFHSGGRRGKDVPLSKVAAAGPMKQLTRF